MKKRRMITAVIGLLAGLCLLPTALPAARVEGGLKLGMNLAWLNGSDAENFPYGGVSWFLRVGLNGGGYLALPLSEGIAIQAEALITTKGSKELNWHLFEYETYTYSLMITYFEVPVLVRLTAPPIMKGTRLFFVAGPAFGFKLGSRLLRSGEALNFGGVRSSELGFVIGVGSFRRSRAFGEFRYTAGLSKVIEEGGVPLNVKNGVFSLIVGYRF